MNVLYTDVGPYLQLPAQDAFSPTSTAMRLKLPASTSTLSKEVSLDCLMYPAECKSYFHFQMLFCSLFG
jgi:hypothetical protein